MTTPDCNGWYLVVLEDGDSPYPIYVRVDGGVLTWAWDEHDDPELMLPNAKIYNKIIPGDDSGNRILYMQ